MASTDRIIVKSIVKNLDYFNDYVAKSVKYPEYLEFPLDNDIQKSIRELKTLEDDEYAIFKRIEVVKTLWKDLVKKAIICLRYFDGREPYLDNPNKNPQAYGIEKLNDYFESYSGFESLLYGGNQYYRDHVVHVFRVWLLGIELLIKKECNFLDTIKVSKRETENPLEKLSIWTLVSLTHDLGYPLEKALDIIGKTKEMMGAFVVNPVVSMDLSFTGVQNVMNDYVLRFISSKMVEIKETAKTIVEEKDEEKKDYVARLQPKYYFKFQKSLEHNDHGVISALIIYKLLIYFLESDYSINEDYYFSKEDCRQFFIRREILRAIASHTCHDIYQQDAFNFSFLLILCDDAQEWGRKYISELYVEKGEKYSYWGIDLSTEKQKDDEKDTEKEVLVCTLTDEYELDPSIPIDPVLSRFKEQSKTYRVVFRDGQDTKNRNFIFKRIMKINILESPKMEYTITLEVSITEQTTITVTRDGNKAIDTMGNFYKAFTGVFKDSTLSEDGKMIRFKL